MSLKTRKLLQRGGKNQYGITSEDLSRSVDIHIRNKTKITREIARSIRRALNAGRTVNVIDGGGNIGICFPVDVEQFR